MTPTYCPLECEASDPLYIRHMGIHVDFDKLGMPPSSDQQNPISHFHSVKEKKNLSVILWYPKPLLPGSTSFFY